MKETVTCRLCGNEYKAITRSHLRYRHNMTMEQYMEQFPDEPMWSEASHLKRCNSAALANADLERRRRQSERMSGENNPFYGKTHDAETRRRMSINIKAAWARDYDRLAEVVKRNAKRGPRVPRRHSINSIAIGGGAKYRARMRALAVHGTSCMIPGCGFDIMVHNHHIVPRYDGGTDDVENCIILCPNHHAMADAGLLDEAYLRELVNASLKKFAQSV